MANILIVFAKRLVRSTLFATFICKGTCYTAITSQSQVAGQNCQIVAKERSTNVITHNTANKYLSNSIKLPLPKPSQPHHTETLTNHHDTVQISNFVIVEISKKKYKKMISSQMPVKISWWESKQYFLEYSSNFVNYPLVCSLWSLWTL